MERKKMKKTLKILLTTLLTLTIVVVPSMITLGNAQDPTDAPSLDPLTIPKYTNQLVIPPVYVPTYSYDCNTHKLVQNYHVDMTEFTEQILPTVDAQGNPTGFAQSLVWGYGGNVKDPITGKYLGYLRNSPGPSFVATKGIPAKVTYENKLTGSSIYAVDPTIMWADPNNFNMMGLDPTVVTPPYNPFPQAMHKHRHPFQLRYTFTVAKSNPHLTEAHSHGSLLTDYTDQTTPLHHQPLPTL